MYYESPDTGGTQCAQVIFFCAFDKIMFRHNMKYFENVCFKLMSRPHPEPNLFATFVVSLKWQGGKI